MKPKVYIQLKDLPDSPKGTEWSIPEGFSYYYPNGDPGYSYAYEEHELLDHPDFWELKEKKRWKPKEGERYFYINLFIGAHIWANDDIDIGNFKIFGCFQTRGEAEIVAQKTIDLWKKESEEDES